VLATLPADSVHCVVASPPPAEDPEIERIRDLFAEPLAAD
jgi:hypothetical protein